MARIAKNGPPEAPWRKFPKIPNRYSLGWKMGLGEMYLAVEFLPWWRAQSRQQREAYLALTQAPDDWREYLALFDAPQDDRDEASA
jgi:hypothetical protein